ncbi:NifB/NifX family molybdenum-iron cluster-binding protein [Candidatus Omnitrophota bacterium]
MRVAISTDGNYVSAHFGRCPSFTIVDIVNGGNATIQEVVDNPGHQPGFIPEFLHQKEVNCIVAGGMGMRAQGLFDEFGIQVIIGVSGKVNEAIEQLKKGTLKGGESLCKPGAGKGYGLDKASCDHPHQEKCDH